MSDKDWIEIVVPASVALADGLAEHLVRTVPAASQGVQVRKADVVFWVDRIKVEETLDAVRQSLSELIEWGWSIDADRVRPGKLAVILHADIADSTILVRQDERIAHERIQGTFRRFE